MKKITFSAALTAALCWITILLLDERPIPTIDLSESSNEPLIFSQSYELDIIDNASISAEFKKTEAVSGKQLDNFVSNNVKDPIGAFNRWVQDFMSGTGGELEGLQLAKLRRLEMARLIREKPAKAIADRLAPDTLDY